MRLDSETSTEKQKTEVPRRTKIIIGISAFILIFSLIVIWWLFVKPCAIPGNVKPFLNAHVS